MRCQRAKLQERNGRRSYCCPSKGDSRQHEQTESRAGLEESGIIAATAQGEIDCFIVGDVTRAELEAAGARIRPALPGIFTAFIPLASVDAVAAIAGVERIEGAQIEEVENNLSVPTTNAPVFRGPGPAFGGLNGAGVIVGNVDTGVDYDHQDFKDALGNTRFLKIWDQPDGGGPPAAGFGYGSDWTAADINFLVSRAKDTHGHGSHTMGIAGGDGSQTAVASAPALARAGRKRRPIRARPASQRRRGRKVPRASVVRGPRRRAARRPSNPAR